MTDKSFWEEIQPSTGWKDIGIICGVLGGLGALLATCALRPPAQPAATSQPAPPSAESIKAKSEFLQYLNCKKGLKMMLKDPSSLKIISKPNGTGPNEIVYSATNSFGARMTDSFDCSSF